MSLAIVTGGGDRVGKMVCLELAALGFDIGLQVRSSMEKGNLVAKEVEALGQSCQVVKSDFSVEDELNSFLSNFKKIPDGSILVNAASSFGEGTFRALDFQHLSEQFSVNLFAPFMISQQFSNRCQSGQIVNIVDAMIDSDNQLNHFAYLLAKKGLRDLTTMSARALAPKIRVNAIAPSWILASPGETVDVDNMMPPIPLNRAGTLDECRQALTYLVSNAYVTGEVLYVDGGRHLL
jgi:pteridine reductase